MASTRLSTSIIEQIVKDVMRYRYAKRIQDHLIAKAVLAEKVYNDVYSPEILKQVNALPKGWVPTTTHISVKFGSSYTQLSFSGNSHGLMYSIGGDVKKLMDVKKPIASKDIHNAAKVYDAIHLFAIEYQRIDEEGKNLERELKETKKSLEVAIKNTATTVKALIERWPALADFAKKYLDAGEIHVPMLQHDKLNEVLGLPPETETRLVG